jgi:hypothetical protein
MVMCKLFSLILIATSLMSCAPALASMGPTHAFEATYEQTSQYGSIKRTVIWDGAKRGRCQMERNGRVTISVIDIERKDMVIFSGDEPTTIPLRDADLAQMGIALKNQATEKESLGTRTIDGKDCVGHRYKQGKSTIETWTDESTGLFVESTTTHPQVGELKSKLTAT